MSSGDSFNALAIVGNEVLRIVESNICMKMDVAKTIGNTLFVTVIS